MVSKIMNMAFYFYFFLIYKYSKVHISYLLKMISTQYLAFRDTTSVQYRTCCSYLPDSLGSPSVWDHYPQPGWSCSLMKRTHLYSYRTWGRSLTHACQSVCSTHTLHHPSHMTPVGCHPGSIQCHVSAREKKHLSSYWKIWTCVYWRTHSYIWLTFPLWPFRLRILSKEVTE